MVSLDHRTLRIKEIILFLGSALFICLVTAVLDRTVIRVWANRIAIPRVERMIYETSEFRYVADINSLGFRDREFSRSNSPLQFTIAILGDSFTYGWGVEESDSWPRVLETILRSQGYQVVIQNLGKPGYFPYMYADVASEYLPVLKPDIVLVGVLQGDDLAQMEYAACGEEQTISSAAKKPASHSAAHKQPSLARRFLPKAVREYVRSVLHAVHECWWSALRVLYPNIMRVRSYRLRTQSTSLSKLSRQQAESIRSRFSPEEADRFARLDGHIRNMFLTGDLNPTLIQMAVTRPSYFADTWELESAKTKELIRRMSECLTDTWQESMRCGARYCAVVSIPYGIYVSKNSYVSRLRLGYSLLPSMLSNNNADTAISLACRNAEVPFISVTSSFRIHAAEEDLFFKYDGHFNARGHKVYAHLLAPAVVDILKQVSMRSDRGQPRNPQYPETGQRVHVR